MVFSPFPRSLRLLLLALVTAGTTAISVIGLPFVFVALGYVGMYVVLAIRNELILDTAKRTYTWRDGIWPLMGSRRGSFDDFRWVKIEARDVLTEAANDPAQTPFVEFSVHLVWNAAVGSRPYHVAKSLNFTIAAQLAADLAQATDTSVIENPTLRGLRSKTGPAPYDARVVVPVDERPKSLAARLRG